MGVKETYEYFKEFNLLHPDILNSLFISRNDVGIEDFLMKSHIESRRIYVNNNKELYTIINPNSSRILNCFGLCYKNASKRVEYLTGKFINKLVKPKEVPFKDVERSFSLGGSLLINSFAKVLFLHRMKFVSDHANPEKILRVIKDIYGNSLREKMVSEFIDNLKLLEINYQSKIDNITKEECNKEINLTEIQEENISSNLNKSINNKTHKRYENQLITNNFKINETKDNNNYFNTNDENNILNESNSLIDSNRFSTNSDKYEKSDM